MNPHAFEFATRSALIRQALAAHQPWIEQKLGVPISDAVIFDSIGNLSQVGLDKLLALTDIRETGSREQRRLRPFVAEAEVPPRYPPILRLRHEVAGRRSLAALLDDREERFSGLDWADCPIAFRLHYYNLTIVTLNVPYQSGPQSHGESVARLLVARRDCAAKTVELIKLLYRRSRTPRLCMLNAKSRAIPHVEWDDLVIDTNVTNLLKNDFESFGERERWFRQRKLPFRRGYLLHGPPGNGKTSAIRAMMNSRGLNAHTLHFFDTNIDDGDLDDLFEAGRRDQPAIVLFEDVDRAFPKTGESGSKISLQHLLNCLDGLATAEGIVVVATANEPALLDPAILRRPGRFDRVVHFPNPGAALRLEYFRHMGEELTDDRLRRPLEASEGFSFAQLREAYITAGQLAFERGGEVTEEDLLAGIRTLRTSMTSGSRRSTSVGF